MRADIIEEGHVLVLMVQADTPADGIAMRLFAKDAQAENILFVEAEESAEGTHAPKLLVRQTGLVTVAGGRPC